LKVDATDSPRADASPLGRSERVRLCQLADSLAAARTRLRYVDYRQAECDCEVLAEKILQTYSRREIGEFRFSSIPRGGLIVLGMLSYALDLRSDQLYCDESSTRPLAIIDDCALTGARLAGALSRTSSQHVLVAHLYSPSGLRDAVLDGDSRVRHCVAAHDLEDFADSDWADPQARREWEERWRQRLDGKRFWYGRPEMVCFAWTEPDRPFWNPVRDSVEMGWKFVPPHRCMKNKVSLGLPPIGIDSARWRLPWQVAFGLFEGVVWLCRTDTEQVFALEGLAADIWRVLAGYGDVDKSVQYLLSRHAVDEEHLRQEVKTFAELLAAKGLLEATA
jgi:Coenzyme PQQ synthesis protein D (PqqD)